MRVHVSKALLSHKGEHLRVADDKDAEIATLKAVLEMALVNYTEPGDDGVAKYARYGLLKRISSARGVIELSVEEIATLKSIVGKSFGTVVVGSVYDALEGVDPAPSEE